MTPARCSLREASFSRLFPLEAKRALSGGLTLAIAYMHSRDYSHGKYDKPETVPVMQRNVKSLPPSVPAKAVIPLRLGENAEEFSLSDARVET
ncbi:hypothetical protein PAAG_03429 [Paracoccidioides lutzii Pb01]|uniref:Uncharacterized protein n=1 Tax=Paracoccidioides lutzii (strain ATCC MYA-826 / Pb01) TaxID=502779 RepID=C1GX55_PARBA|nr:hypothetical protein PAAG_03429 [Paracoccidioides lutzii Pb01]EEH41143.2 hypothetical protein PAAG_03429 [Paracoccidioides lutzii Pb01]